MSFNLKDVVKLKGDEDHNYMYVKQIDNTSKQLVAEHRGRLACGEFCEFELVTGDSILDKLRSVLVNMRVVSSHYNNNSFTVDSERFHIKYNLFERIGPRFNIRVKSGGGRSVYTIDEAISYINICERKISLTSKLIDDLVLAETQLVLKPNDDTLLNAEKCRAKLKEHLNTLL